MYGIGVSLTNLNVYLQRLDENQSMLSVYQKAEIY